MNLIRAEIDVLCGVECRTNTNEVLSFVTGKMPTDCTVLTFSYGE